MSETIGQMNNQSEQYSFEEISFSSTYPVFFCQSNSFSILSSHRRQMKVFGRSKYVNQESVAKQGQQLKDLNSACFILVERGFHATMNGREKGSNRSNIRIHAFLERILYGHQGTVKALGRSLKAMTISPVKKSKCLGSVSPVREPPRTKTSRQQTAVAVTIRPQVLINKVNVATIPKGRNQSHTNQKSAVAQKEQKINRMGYVEVENCRLNRKLVSSHPNYQLELTKFYQGIGGEDCLDLGGVLE